MKFITAAWDLNFRKMNIRIFLNDGKIIKSPGSIGKVG